MAYKRLLEAAAADLEEKVSDELKEKIQDVVRLEFAQARDFMDTYIAPIRAEALRRYRGEPYGDELPNRSSIVSTDLRDTVLAVLPSLCRIFMGGERMVELVPRGPEDEEAARQRSDYLNLVLMDDNPGYLTLYTAFKEALAQEYAVVKWWWEDKTERVTEVYEGQTQEQAIALASAEDVVEAAYEESGVAEVPAQLMDGQVPQPSDGQSPWSMQVPVYTVKIVRERKISRARYDCVPGEEFYVSANARSLQDARIVTHAREVTRSDLLAMGYSAEEIDQFGRFDGATLLGSNLEYLTRYKHTYGEQTPASDEMQRTLYCEHYIRVSRSDDTPAELFKVCTIGTNFDVVHIEPVPEVPFAIFCADPEPHKIFGSGFHSLLRDISQIKTHVLRATMESLRASIDPMLAINENVVEFQDVTNPALAKIIRVDGDPNMAIREIAVPFAGQAGLAMIDYLDQIIERRSGQTKTSLGLNADVLQSTTKAAITAQLSAAQQRIEMIARTLAETGIKALIMGLQRLLMRHQDIPRTVRLRGKWVEVDPKTWEVAFDVKINVPLGVGSQEERIAQLMEIAARQEKILQTIGPGPLTNFQNYRATLAKILELSGWTNPGEFFGEVPPDWKPAGNQQPNPDMMLAQAAIEEARAKIAQQNLKTILDIETERMKLEADMQLKILELELKYQQQIEEARVQREIELMRQRTQATIEQYKALLGKQSSQPEQPQLPGPQMQ
jgi:hypothetical protein